VFVNRIFDRFYLEFDFWQTLRCILQKLHTIVWKSCGYTYVKLYLIRWSFPHGIAKSLGAHFFLDTVYRHKICLTARLVVVGGHRAGSHDSSMSHLGRALHPIQSNVMWRAQEVLSARILNDITLSTHLPYTVQWHGRDAMMESCGPLHSVTSRRTRP